ncbi:hypothetical protein AB0J14_05185 [Micromonospora arborensis]|uniref:hypothetical protein n=1 Tax=Micromonospora arborensis TaxID=2116518 RepID=UPI0033C06410
MTMTTLPAGIANPYWDAVRDRVDWAGSLWGTPSVGGIGMYRHSDGRLDGDRWMREALKRSDMVKQYAWTITDPETVAFVAEHSRGRLVDPLAGTGYWVHILGQAGVDAIAYDLNPPSEDHERNHWHRHTAGHVAIGEADAKDAVSWHPSRTLLLSWPPYDDPLGVETVRAYQGGRVIFIGEDWGGCCGDDTLFEVFEREWVKVAEHTPVQWDGMHDIVHVYDRKEG